MGCLTVIGALLGMFFCIWLLETIDGIVWLVLGILAVLFFVVLFTANSSSSASSYAQSQKQKGRLLHAKMIDADQCKLIKMTDGGWLIEKFVGMDEPVMEIPKEFNGIPIHAIGSKAFENCANLTGIKIPEGVREIRWGAFYGCKQLCDVLLPSTVQYIRGDAFSYTSLKECDLPKEIKTIERGVFAGTDLMHVEIPSHIVSIENEAFFNCKKLKRLTLHEGLIEIGDKAFQECAGLRQVTIPYSVTKIGENAFGKIGYGNLDITLYCYSGSYGMEYARKNRFAYKKAMKK